MQRFFVLFIMVISFLYSADRIRLASFESPKDAQNAIHVFDKILKSIDKNYHAKVVKRHGSYEVILDREIPKNKEMEIVTAVNSYFGEVVLVLREKEKNSFYGKAILGIGYDDNIYHHTDIATTPYADLFIENNTTALSDTFHREIFIVQHQYQFDHPSWEWHSMGMIYNKAYASYNDLDLLQLSLYGGPQYISGKHLLAVSAYEKKLWYGGEDYLDTYGILSKYQYLMNENIKLYIQAEVSAKRFVDEDQRDWDINRVALKNSIELIEDNKPYFLGEVGIYGERRLHGGRTDVSYDALYIRGKYLLPLSEDSTLGAKLSYESREYRDKHPNLLLREDDKWGASIEFSQKITEDITAKLHYSYTKNDSTINLYTYDNGVMMLDMSSVF